MPKYIIEGCGWEPKLMAYTVIVYTTEDYFCSLSDDRPINESVLMVPGCIDWAHEDEIDRLNWEGPF